MVEGMGRPTGCGDGGQALGSEVVGEGGERPVVGGVFGESLGDEWAADRVDVDPAGFPALVVAALFVEVA